MGTRVDTLKKLLEDMNYTSMMAVTNCVWCRGDEFQWNTDDNIEDLVDGAGETYNGYQTEGWVEFDGYLVVNLDTEQGYWVTYLFDISKEVKADE